MDPPIEPSKEDCCNSGCNPCIFEVYEKQLLLYKKFQEGIKVSEILLSNGISQLHYTTFNLLDTIELCEAHKLLTFKLTLSDKNVEVSWNPGEHFLVKYTNESFSCTRAYTPIKQKSKTNVSFSIIVKKYTDGIVSNYLWNLEPGQESLWRGPYGAYKILPNAFQRLIMIAQGTGIAPFISIIESILDNEDDMTKLILNYCCKNIKSIPMRNELYSLKSYWNFTYSVFLSDFDQNDVYKYNESIVNHKLRTKDLSQIGPFSEKDQLLLCGSTQFMEHFKSWAKDQALTHVITF